jgi:hypothetical protein
MRVSGFARTCLPLALAAAGVLALGGCVPRPRIVSPAQSTSTALDGTTPVQIQLGGTLSPSARLRVTLLRGIDTPPASPLDVSARVQIAGSTATATLAADDLLPGRNALYVSLDDDGDGRPENVTSSVFRWDPVLGAACKRKITPVVGENHSDPIYMAGFSNDRQPLGVHDDQWARGWVVQNADRKIAVVTLDVIGYFNNEVQTIRALPEVAALGFDAIMVTSTHQHEGPDTMGLWGPDETTTGVDIGYLDFVNAQVAGCLADANAALVPAELRFATGSTVGASLAPWPDLVADGRVLEALVIPGNLFTPPRAEDVVVEGDAGPIVNPSVPALQIRNRLTQETIATVVNYASHPESLGSGNRLLTSDFPHFMREALEAEYGGIAIYVSADLGVLQGPLDVDLIDPATGQPAERRTFRFAQVMGEALAERARTALEAAPAWDANPALATYTSGPLQVRVENPYFIAASNFPNYFGRRRLERNAQRQIVVTSEVNVLRVGPAQMAVTPNELDPQIAYGYKDRMTNAEHKWVLGLGNDEVGYQMPQAKFNPACHACAPYVLLGDTADCPIAQELGEEIVDCDTIFINNIGPSADPLLQGRMNTLLDEANAP